MGTVLLEALHAQCHAPYARVPNWYVSLKSSKSNRSKPLMI